MDGLVPRDDCGAAMSLTLREAVETYRREALSNHESEVALVLGLLLRTWVDMARSDDAAALRLALSRILCADAEATNEPHERLDKIRQLAHEALGQREE